MNIKTKNIMCILILFLILGTGKADTSMDTAIVKSQAPFTINNIEQDALINLHNKKIYFGHQSVGDNILQGLKELMEKYPGIKLNLTVLNKNGSMPDKTFSHSYIGVNEKPNTKAHSFVEMMNGRLKGEADAAFFKYCYIDFNKNTDVRQVFDTYKTSIQKIRKNNPDTLIIHITTPLSTVQTGLKAWIKKILGKPIGGIDANVKRNMYNNLLLSEYHGKDAIFDLASLESTRPNGLRQTFNIDGNVYYSLAPEYTDDGGHLNEDGRLYIAEKFILFLVKNIN